MYNGNVAATLTSFFATIFQLSRYAVDVKSGEIPLSFQLLTPSSVYFLTFIPNKMSIKRYLPFIFCFLTFALSAQTPEKYASVRIDLVGKQIGELVKTGIETEHAQYYPGKSITVVLSTSELSRVQQAGFKTEVLIDDLTAHFLNQSKQSKTQTAARNGCFSVNAPGEYETPANYSYGSMAGYLTYTEMLEELDKMRTLYPNLISARKNASDTIQTWDGRVLQYVKISDNPDQDEAEREILYTALHHAREPNSASQLIFYMWYLLENYQDRADIKGIVDNLEMYFVPCINPDGYVYNETTNPDGGGFWRKNRRNNGDGTFGVDLNRNYGYFWGDLGGSSGDPFSEIYRGPAAFSEPESRTMRDLCLAHEFLFVLNYHTSGNLLIYPWAYSDSPANSTFVELAKTLTRENNYFFGTTTETVGYNVNGSSDDWMYAEAGAFSFTPEVGNTGFWPTFDQIDGFNKDNLWQNLFLAYAALRYGEAVDLTGEQISGLNSTIDVEFTRHGLMDGPITVSLEPVSGNITSGVASKSFDLQHLAKETYSFPFQLSPTIGFGEEVVFVLKTDNGFWVEVDTLKKLFNTTSAGTVSTVFQDALTNSQKWTGNWSITDETFYSAPSCMTESPNENYSPSFNASTQLAQAISIPVNATTANLRFFAKWSIEEGWDYTQVNAIIASSGVSQPLCGQYTSAGVNTQPEGEPVLDGSQTDWVEECMPLTDYIGQSFWIEVVFQSDGFVEDDGFYFDDVRIEYTTPTSGTQTISLRDFMVLQNEPNPASGETLIRWETSGVDLGEAGAIQVFNSLGELVLTQNVNLRQAKSARIDTKAMAPGMYSYVLKHEKGQSQPVKMTVVH